jgi:hypothetical protein
MHALPTACVRHAHKTQSLSWLRLMLAAATAATSFGGPTGGLCLVRQVRDDLAGAAAAIVQRSSTSSSTNTSSTNSYSPAAPPAPMSLTDSNQLDWPVMPVHSTSHEVPSCLIRARCCWTNAPRWGLGRESGSTRLAARPCPHRPVAVQAATRVPLSFCLLGHCLPSADHTRLINAVSLRKRPNFLCLAVAPSTWRH